jgi:hypothetical protein
LIGKSSCFLGGLNGDQIAEDVMRFLTFSALGLTHTFYHYKGAHFQNDTRIRIMEPVEIDEIREEELELTKRLDDLVCRFMEDFQTLELLLSRFLQNWHKTMVEELQDER